MSLLDTVLTVLAVLPRPPDAPGNPAAIPVREKRIGHGDRGARQMVAAMAQEARAALRNPLTFRVVETILPMEAHAADRIFFLREWLSTRFFFLPDPHGVEVLRTPDLLLRTIQERGHARGDCDDAATLAAALGLAAGIPARFVLFAFGDFPFSHVFCELHSDCQGWMEFDITRPAQLPEGIRVARAETHEV